MKNLRVKHIYVEPKDFPEVKTAICRIFSDPPDLDKFDGILITTDEHPDVTGLRIKDGK